MAALSVIGPFGLLSVRPTDGLTQQLDTSRSEILTSTFSSLFCYSGWSQFAQVI